METGQEYHPGDRGKPPEFYAMWAGETGALVPMGISLDVWCVLPTQVERQDRMEQVSGMRKHTLHDWVGLDRHCALFPSPWFCQACKLPSYPRPARPAAVHHAMGQNLTETQMPVLTHYPVFPKEHAPTPCMPNSSCYYPTCREGLLGH